MCGINGVVDFINRYSVDKRHNIVHRMNQQIIYRGPDDEGIFDGPWLSMGMRRLSIIDLASGRQPIFNEDGSIVIVFNGEIYNYKMLRKELEKKGHSFKTNSDTEVIVHLYEEKSVGAFSELDGMFSFAIYDRNIERLYVVRDRMGEKPLFYSNINGSFAFGSELKSLSNCNLIEKNIDETALTMFLQYTYIPAPLTIYKDVKKLSPGHYVEISNAGDINVKQYWHLSIDHDIEKMSYDEAIDELRVRLNKSVKDRMNCDVPYGAFLSGGLDSGIISTLMAKNSTKPINTFSIGFEEADYDESKNAAILAKNIGSKHHTEILKYNQAMEIIEEIVNNMDEPFADSSALPVFLVSRFAAKNVKVVLTGDAGDECFLGYDKYLIHYYSDLYNKVPAFMRKNVIEKALSHMNDTSVLSRKIGKVVRNASQTPYERTISVMKLGFKNNECISLLKDGVADFSGDSMISSRYNEIDASQIRKTQYVDLRYVLEGDMLAKVDRMSMRNSLETRTPLIANDIVQFAFSLQDNYKIEGKNKKKILKDAFEGILPEGYTRLPKSGFGIPLDHWFRNEMQIELKDVLSANQIRKHGLFSEQYINQIISEHLDGRVNRKSELWALYVFQRWYDNN